MKRNANVRFAPASGRGGGTGWCLNDIAIARPAKQSFAVGPVVDHGGEAFGRAALMLPALELPEESDAVVEQLEQRYAGVAVCTTSASVR